MDGWRRLPFLIAHRGASARAPENTLRAFEEALDAGAEVLECDVQMSRDGVAIVMHDPTVDRTTDGRGAVRRLSWHEIRALDAGYPARFGDAFAGQRVPRLEELFDLARGRAEVFVEIKPEALADSDGRIEAGVVEAARSTGMMDAVGVLSFAPRALQRVRALAPDFPLGLVFRWWRRRRLVEETLRASADYLVAYTPRLFDRPETVVQAHAAGLRVGAYVADSPELVQGLLQLGVDGIATNRVGDVMPGFPSPAAP
ncbi:MAG: glycerophosphodiester phosphodiesterase family protein [Acidobacteriota bacterium]|jgi:glycerophosphoryl diester phosphodiesterase